MTLMAALLTGIQAAYLQINFMVVSSMVPIILVVGLVHLVADTVVNPVELVVRQLLFQFLVSVSILSYAVIMVYTWRRVCMWQTCQYKFNEIVVTNFPLECLVQAVH